MALKELDAISRLMALVLCKQVLLELTMLVQMGEPQLPPAAEAVELLVVAAVVAELLPVVQPVY